MNAYRQGKEAALSGAKESDCPHKEGTRDYEEWIGGFYYEEVMEKTHKGRKEWQ